MVNPQLEDGYIRIANEIWDQVMMRNFTKRQRGVLDLILRLSYGCKRKDAIIPRLNLFVIAGIRPNHIRAELERLEESRVISWDRNAMVFEFNKRYTNWKIPVATDENDEILKELIALNLGSKLPKKGRIAHTKLPEKGSREPSKSDETSQNGKSDFPKQEVALPKTGSLDFPKQEVEHLSNPINDGPNEPRKDSIKDSLKTTKDIQTPGTLVSQSSDMQLISTRYEKRIGMMGPTQYENLRFWHEEQQIEADAICHAIDIAGDARDEKRIRGNTDRYLNGIIRGMYNDGVRSLSDLEQLDQERGQQRRGRARSPTRRKALSNMTSEELAELERSG